MVEQTESRKAYRDWDLLDELPEGWRHDKTCGSPLHGYVFCTNGRSLISGMQKRALVKWVGGKTAEAEATKQEICEKAEPIERPRQEPDLSWRKTVNELARERFKLKLLSDISVDLMVCEIEGWSKLEYINEIKKLVNGIGIRPMSSLGGKNEGEGV